MRRAISFLLDLVMLAATLSNSGAGVRVLALVAVCFGLAAVLLVVVALVLLCIVTRRQPAYPMVGGSHG